MLVSKSVLLIPWLLVVSTALDNSRDAKILNYDFQNNGSNAYEYSFKTSDGTNKDEGGALVDENTEDEALLVNGQFMYVGVDGKVYIVRYRADDNGFHPEGEHLKVPPYVPWLKGQPHDDGQYHQQDADRGQDVPKPLVLPNNFPGFGNRIPVSDLPQLKNLDFLRVRPSPALSQRPGFSNRGPSSISVSPVEDTAKPPSPPTGFGSSGSLPSSGTPVLSFGDRAPLLAAQKPSVPSTRQSFTSRTPTRSKPSIALEPGPQFTDNKPNNRPASFEIRFDGKTLQPPSSQVPLHPGPTRSFQPSLSIGPKSGLQLTDSKLNTRPSFEIRFDEKTQQPPSSQVPSQPGPSRFFQPSIAPTPGSQFIDNKPNTRPASFEIRFDEKTQQPPSSQVPSQPGPSRFFQPSIAPTPGSQFIDNKPNTRLGSFEIRFDGKTLQPPSSQVPLQPGSNRFFLPFIAPTPGSQSIDNKPNTRPGSFEIRFDGKTQQPPSSQVPLKPGPNRSFRPSFQGRLPFSGSLSSPEIKPANSNIQSIAPSTSSQPGIKSSPQVTINFNNHSPSRDLETPTAPSSPPKLSFNTPSLRPTSVSGSGLQPLDFQQPSTKPPAFDIRFGDRPPSISKPEPIDRQTGSFIRIPATPRPDTPVVDSSTQRFRPPSIEFSSLPQENLNERPPQLFSPRPSPSTLTKGPELPSRASVVTSKSDAILQSQPPRGGAPAFTINFGSTSGSQPKGTQTRRLPDVSFGNGFPPSGPGFSTFAPQSSRHTTGTDSPPVPKRPTISVKIISDRPQDDSTLSSVGRPVTPQVLKNRPPSKPIITFKLHPTPVPSINRGPNYKTVTSFTPSSNINSNLNLDKKLDFPQKGKGKSFPPSIEITTFSPSTPKIGIPPINSFVPTVIKTFTPGSPETETPHGVSDVPTYKPINTLTPIPNRQGQISGTFDYKPITTFTPVFHRQKGGLPSKQLFKEHSPELETTKPLIENNNTSPVAPVYRPISTFTPSFGRGGSIPTSKPFTTFAPGAREINSLSPTYSSTPIYFESTTLVPPRPFSQPLDSGKTDLKFTVPSYKLTNSFTPSFGSKVPGTTEKLETERPVQFTPQPITSTPSDQPQLSQELGSKKPGVKTISRISIGSKPQDSGPRVLPPSRANLNVDNSLPPSSEQHSGALPPINRANVNFDTHRSSLPPISEQHSGVLPPSNGANRNFGTDRNSLPPISEQQDELPTDEPIIRFNLYTNEPETTLEPFTIRVPSAPDSETEVPDLSSELGVGPHLKSSTPTLKPFTVPMSVDNEVPNVSTDVPDSNSFTTLRPDQDFGSPDEPTLKPISAPKPIQDFSSPEQQTPSPIYYLKLYRLKSKKIDRKTPIYQPVTFTKNGNPVIPVRAILQPFAINAQGFSNFSTNLQQNTSSFSGFNLTASLLQLRGKGGTPRIFVPASFSGPLSGIIIGSVEPSTLPEVYSSPFVGVSIANLTLPIEGIKVGTITTSSFPNSPSIPIDSEFPEIPSSISDIDLPFRSKLNHKKPPPSGFKKTTEGDSDITTQKPFLISTTVAPFYLPLS